MQALILSDNPLTHHRLSRSLSRRGFQVVHSETVMMATAHVRAWAFDLVLMVEQVGGQLTHRVALSAEKHAPFVKTILLSNRTDTEIDELYELLPSLAGIVSPELAPELIIQIATASVAGSARTLEPDAKADPEAPQFSSTRQTIGLEQALAG